MKIEEILKIADINYNELDKQFVSFLTGVKPNWKDNDSYFNEHIYSINSLIEFVEENPHLLVNTTIRGYLAEIETLLNENDCGYFRVTDKPKKLNRLSRLYVKTFF